MVVSRSSGSVRGLCWRNPSRPLLRRCFTIRNLKFGSKNSRHEFQILNSKFLISKFALGAEHDAPDAHHEVEQNVGIVAVEVAEHDNARLIGGKHDAE